MIKRFVTFAVIFAAGFALCTVINGKNPVSFAKEALSSRAAFSAPAQNTQVTPQLWDYRVVTRYILRDNKGGIDQELSALGAQGFEIDTVTESREKVGGFYLAIVLRRPKQ
jgi:hypothetical protein